MNKYFTFNQIQHDLKILKSQRIVYSNPSLIKKSLRQIKYGKLVKILNKQKYENLKEQSKQKLVVFYQQYNKVRYSIRTQASYEQANNVKKQCELKIKQDGLIEKYQKILNITIDNEYYNCILGKQNIQWQADEPIFERQFNIVSNEKEFKCNLTHRLTNQHYQNFYIISDQVRKQKWIGPILIKNEYTYFVSSYYKIIVIEEIQISNEIQIKKFKKIIHSRQNIDQFLLNQDQMISSFRVQLVFTHEGIEYISDLEIKPLINFIGRTIDAFQQYSESIPFPQMKKYMQQK